MPGIEDLTNIMMAGGRPDVPMPPPPPGPPTMGGPTMGGPTMGGPPQGPPPGPPQGPPPPDMMARNQGPPPEMMAGQMPMEEQAPEMSIEQDSMALAEAVVGRAQGDIQMAVTILDTAKDMLMQSAEQSPQMMKYGGDIRPGRPTPPPPPPRVNPSMSGAGMARRANQARRLGSRGPGGWNMGGPLYAAKGRALSDSEYIDDTEVLKQMIMDGLRDEMAYGERDVSDADIERAYAAAAAHGQKGRTLTDKDLAFHLEMLGSEEEPLTQSGRRFRDYQPEYEGLPEDYKSKMDDSWFGKLRKFIPDAYQVNEWLADKKGFPSISDIDADDLRQYKGNRALERGMGDKLAGRRQELQDRTISEMISDEELRNEMRMLEREEPSEARQRALDELMEYRNR